MAKNTFDLDKYYRRFPKISHSEIKICISKIATDSFTTHDFIDKWVEIYDISAKLFKLAGGRWRPAIGRQLSLFSRETRLIQRNGGSGRRGQRWKKRKIVPL